MNRIFPALAMGAAILTVSLMAQPQFPPPQSQGQPAPQATQPNQDQQADPPSRVARLNWISGDVAYQPATVDTWTNATLNYPLTTGDHIFVNAGARAELHIGGSAIRLNSNSNFGFLNLNDSIVQMSFNQGSLELRLRQLDQNDSYEIDTPNGAVTLLRAGDYRVDTDPARRTATVCWSHRTKPPGSTKAAAPKSIPRTHATISMPSSAPAMTPRKCFRAAITFRNR